MTKSILIATTVLIASTAGALAHTPNRNDIDARQQRQLGIIEQGRQSGDITWREGLRLRAQQRNIAATEARLASDGRLSKGDRRHLNDLQLNASDRIYAESTDRRRRLWWAPRFGR